MFLSGKKIGVLFAALTAAFVSMQSCNKEFDDIGEVETLKPMQTAGDLIETDGSFSILKAAVTKAGLWDVLKNPGNNLTVFAPDDAALTASGISMAAVDALPAGQLQSLLQYHVIAQALPAEQISTDFPNVQMPTLLPLLQTNPLAKLSIFPSRRNSSLFVNNIPVTEADIVVENGIVHKVAGVVAPPSQLVAQIIGADSDLSLFRAAVARADSGQTGLNRLDSVMKYGLANVTVFVPNNAAVQQLLIALGLPPSEMAFQFLPVQTVRGIVAYHMLGSRAFSVNLPATTSTIQTLIGASPFPQLTVDRSTALPRLLGAGNGAQYANFVATDRHGVNGVVHVIDVVLRPQ